MTRRRKFLLASVLAVQSSTFVYPSCQNCFSRVVLGTNRFTCPKCGSAGEAENASYRYKLPLKVAESNKLFVITVFGSCLDAFFGLTASGLHRFLQDSDNIPESLGSGATQSLLKKAAELCFVGQSFVFGVTNFGDVCGRGPESGNFLQQRRALVASQMILPDPSVAGFPVIAYLRGLLQTCSSEQCHSGSEEQGSQFAFNLSSSPLSGFYGFRNTSDFLESHNRDGSLRFLPPSLELTSSTSQLTDHGFSPEEPSTASGPPLPDRQRISSGSLNYPDSTQGSSSSVSRVDPGNAAGSSGEECDLQANHLRAVHSSPETGLPTSHVFLSQMQEPLEGGHGESVCRAAEINRPARGELPCHQHHDTETTGVLPGGSPHFTPSSFIPQETTGASQDVDSCIWDDLPLSESLNKFLAVVESEVAVTRTEAMNATRAIDNDIEKFNTNHSRLPVTSREMTGALNTTPRRLRSSHTGVKENSTKNFFCNCESFPSTQVLKESTSGCTAEPVSSKEGPEYFQPKTDLSDLFARSKDTEAIVSYEGTVSILPRRSDFAYKSNASQSDHYLSNKYFNIYGKKSLSEMKEKLAVLCSKKYHKVSDLHRSENKQYCKCPEEQSDSLTICRKLTYPSETFCSSPRRSTHILREISYGYTHNLTQSDTAGHEGSYNASADLFGDISKDKDTGTEINKNLRDISLPWEASLAENHPADETSRQCSPKLSLQSLSASKYPRICSPPPPCQSNSEYDLESSQDFVPCSQSTPVANFYHRRILGLSGVLKKVSSFYPNLDTNYKKTKISYEDEQQGTPLCLKNIKTPGQKSKCPASSRVTQPDVFSPCPAAESFETDDEWIPPTTQKVFLSDRLGLEVTKLRKCLVAHSSPDQKDLPRKKLMQAKHKADKFI